MKVLVFAVAVAAVMAVAQAASPMAGGYSPVSTNDANVLKAFALAEAAVKNASTTPVANVTLDSAESQVVAGTNYKLVMTATGPNGADPMKWMAVVYSPLSGPMNVTSVDALALMPPMAPSMAPSMAPGPEMMAGGYSPADITAANVQKAFDTAKAQLIKDELNGDTKANVTLVKAEQQVVAGTNYMLTMAVTAADGTVKHYDALVNEALPANGGALTVSSITDASGMGPAAAPMLAAMGSVGSASAPTPAPSSAAAATAGVATMAAIVLALI